MSKLSFAVGMATLITGCAQPPNSLRPAEWETKVKTFFALKEAQARHLAEMEQLDSDDEKPKEMAPEVWAYFEAGKLGDWRKAGQYFSQMSLRSYQFAADEEDVDDRLSSMVWQPVNETHRFLEQCSVADSRHLLAYGQEVIKSIPPGSIYLCGSDPGRFVIAGLCRDQPAGDPIFVVSPNQLSDGLFLRYLESMYATKIQVLTPDDSQAAFKDYLQDVQQRAREEELKPGEQLSFANGLPKVKGPRAVFEIIARLTKTFFLKNPARDFYVDLVDDGYPMEWMFPHLTPHGPTLHLIHQPLTELAPEVVARDRAYWTETTASFVGDWITREASVHDICAFSEKVYVRKDLSNFTGDKSFVTTARSWHWQATHLGASAAWGHARAAIACVYAWRSRNARDAEQQRRMLAQADLAFRQALVLCPYSRETVYNFANHLLALNRADDALLVTDVASKLNPDECHSLHRQVKEIASRLPR